MRKRDVLAPGRGDDLHADRQRPQRHRHRDDRQADEGNRLGENADDSAAPAVSTPSSTNVCWPISGAVQGVAGARIASTSSNSRSTLLAIPAAEFLRLDDQRRRHHGAGDQPVAHVGIEIGGRVRSRSRCSAAPSVVVMI